MSQEVLSKVQLALAAGERTGMASRPQTFLFQSASLLMDMKPFAGPSSPSS